MVVSGVGITKFVSFNTASGMDCMQYVMRSGRLRERRFNTASGMDCMQSKESLLSLQKAKVSIPQAVWIACNKNSFIPIRYMGSCFNTASGMDCMQ